MAPDDKAGTPRVALLSAVLDMEYLAVAFREFAQQRPLHALGTAGYPWIEIDFPEDYRRATRDILPAIENAHTAAVRAAADASGVL